MLSRTILTGGTATSTEVKLARLAGSPQVRQMAAAPPHAPNLMATAPVVTQDTSVRGGLTSTYTQTHLRWSGPLAASPTVGGSMQPRGTTNAAGAINSNARVASVAFDFDGRYLDINLRAYTTLRWRIWVNEQCSTNDLELLPSGTGANAFLHLDFGSSSQPDPRRIVVEFEDQSTAITVFGLRAAPTDYFAPPAASSPRVIWVGDSYARGAGGATRESFSYARTVGRLMGWADCWNVISSFAGTGLVHANDATQGPYLARLAYDVIPYAPDLVVVQGSVNDEADSATVGAALTTYVQTLRGALPGVPVVVTSPLYVANPTANHLAVNVAMKAAAASLGVPYVDALDPQVFTGTGAASNPDGSGNADYFRGSDFTHPTNAGAYALAKRVSGLLGQALDLPVGETFDPGELRETSTLPTLGGTAAVGSSTKVSAANHVHPRYEWGPTDHGLITWTYDPIQASSASSTTNGQLQLIRIHVPVAATVTNVLLSVAAAGTSMTSGQNFAGLWDLSRNLLSITADQSTPWATAGVQTMALATPQTVTAGDLYVGFWVRSTGTAPTFNRALSNLLVNAGLSSANSRFATSTGSLTTTAPNPAGALSPGSVSFWAALS